MAGPVGLDIHGNIHRHTEGKNEKKHATGQPWKLCERGRDRHHGQMIINCETLRKQADWGVEIITKRLQCGPVPFDNFSLP